MMKWKHLQITQIPHHFQIRNWKTDSKGRILEIVISITLRHATFNYKVIVLGTLRSKYFIFTVYIACVRIIHLHPDTGVSDGLLIKL